MSRLVYNGVELSYITTPDVTQEPAYDESGTDVLGYRHTLKCNAILTPNSVPTLAGDSPAKTLALIEHALKTPRRSLYFETSGTVLYNIVPGTPDNPIQNNGKLPDIANGPKPVNVVVSQLSDGSILIAFAVEFTISNCDQTPTLFGGGWQSDPRVISHRWTETETISPTTAAEITRSGKIVSRSDLLANPDQLRLLVFPPPPGKNFEFAGGQVSNTPDNLALDYSFKWREVQHVVPFPAYKCNAETLVNHPGIAMRELSYTIDLEGRVGIKKADLIRLALACFSAKVGKDAIAGIKLSKIQIASSDYEPKVSLRAKCALKMVDPKSLPEKDRFMGLSVDMSIFSENRILSGPPDGNATINIDNNDTLIKKYGQPIDPRGTSGYKLIVALLRDPCKIVPDVQQVASNTPATQDVTLSGGSFTTTLTTTTNVTLSTGGTGPITSFVNQYSPGLNSFKDDDPGVYTEWGCSKQYSDNRRDVILVVPVADSPAATVTYDSNTGLYSNGTAPVKAEIVQLAPVTYFCTVRFRAKRVGKPPKRPKAVPPKDSGWVLIDEDFTEDDPKLTPDGQLEYETHGFLKYVIPDPSKAKIIPAVSPYLKEVPSQFTNVVNESETILFPSEYKNAKSMPTFFPDNLPGSSTQTVTIGPGGNQSQI